MLLVLGLFVPLLHFLKQLGLKIQTQTTKCHPTTVRFIVLILSHCGGHFSGHFVQFSIGPGPYKKNSQPRPFLYIYKQKLIYAINWSSPNLSLVFKWLGLNPTTMNPLKLESVRNSSPDCMQRQWKRLWSFLGFVF